MQILPVCRSFSATIPDTPSEKTTRAILGIFAEFSGADYWRQMWFPTTQSDMWVHGSCVCCHGYLVSGLTGDQCDPAPNSQSVINQARLLRFLCLPVTWPNKAQRTYRQKAEGVFPRSSRKHISLGFDRVRSTFTFLKCIQSSADLKLNLSFYE